MDFSTFFIAIVDDEFLIRQEFIQLSNVIGFKALIFDSGEEFLDYCVVRSNKTPDIALLDIVLGGMDGLAVLKAALQIPRLSETIYVAHTAFLKEIDEKWIGYIGFDEIILKPADDDEYRGKFESLILNRDSILADRNPYKNLFEVIKELSDLRIRTSVLEKNYIQKLISPFVFRALDSKKELKPCYKNVAIGIVDIRGFTQLLNQLEINHVNKILNNFFTMCVETIDNEEGFVDKFVGDEVIWFHQDSEFEENSRQCVRTAIKILKNLKKVNKVIRNRLHIDIKIEVGFGIACGSCAVGIFGSPKYRIQYSVLGPSVNLASRLCSLARAGEILIGGEIIEYCQYKSTKVGFQAIKGFDNDIEVRRLSIPRKL